MDTEWELPKPVSNECSISKIQPLPRMCGSCQYLSVLEFLAMDSLCGSGQLCGIKNLSRGLVLSLKRFAGWKSRLSFFPGEILMQTF